MVVAQPDLFEDAALTPLAPGHHSVAEKKAAGDSPRGGAQGAGWTSQWSQASWNRACASSSTVSSCITRVDSDEGTLLRIDGRLEAESLNELERNCRGAQSPLTLNIEERVRWINDRAAERYNA